MPKRVHKLGYVVAAPGESIAQALSWYRLDNMSMAASNLKRDVETTFANMPCRVVTVYELRLVRVGRCMKKRKGKK